MLETPIIVVLIIAAIVAVLWFQMSLGGPSPRRFPPPWTVEELEACFVVKDRTGQALAHIYYEDAGQPAAAKPLSRDEARRIAANFAKLPGLVRKD